jgi:cell fate regulator YaaT (PSP1 superfamily)
MEISGVCGRLLCCLAYEEEHYAETKKRLPRRGDFIDTPRGKGRVVSVNAVKESVQVELENEVRLEVLFEGPVAPPLPTPEVRAPEAPHRKRGKRRHKPSAAPR